MARAVPVPFLYDFEAHVRFLVAIPLFLLAEVVVHQRLRPVVRSFVDAGIVTPAVLPGFQAAIARAMRLRNSLAVELTLAVLVFGSGGCWDKRDCQPRYLDLVRGRRTAPAVT